MPLRRALLLVPLAIAGGWLAFREHAVSGGGRLSPWWTVALVIHVASTIAGLVWLNAPFRARRRELRAASR